MWRTGWEEWHRVDQVTAELPQVTADDTPIVLAESKGPSANTRYNQRRRRQRKRNMMIAISLGCMAIGLGVVLVMVLLGNLGGTDSNSTKTSSSQPAASDNQPLEQQPTDQTVVDDESDNVAPANLESENIDDGSSNRPPRSEDTELDLEEDPFGNPF